MSGFISVISAIVIALLIITIIVVLVVYIYNQKTTKDNAFNDLVSEIGYLRQRRYLITSTMIEDFGHGNSLTSKIQGLISTYPNIKNDADEQTWEKDFLPSMKAFIIEANQNAVSPAAAANLKSVLSEFTVNEQELRSHRERYRLAMEDLARYDAFPLKIFIVIGDVLVKLTGRSVKRYNQAVTAYGAFQDAQEERHRREENAFFGGDLDE